jgi:hypothetical protein
MPCFKVEHYLNICGESEENKQTFVRNNWLKAWDLNSGRNRNVNLSIAGLGSLKSSSDDPVN